MLGIKFTRFNVYLGITFFSLSTPILASIAEDNVEVPNPSVKQFVKPTDSTTESEEEKESTDFIFDKMSGSAALTSNFIFRGLTQTENLPAAQAEFTYTFPMELYLSLWGSNSKFAETDITLEIDPIIGYYHEFNDYFNIDIYLYRSIYPSASEFNYNEWIATINYKFLQSNLGYSTNVYNVHKEGYYYNGGINYEIPSEYIFGYENEVLLALVGHYHLPKAADLSYSDYTLGLSKTFKNYNISIQWTTTDHTEYYGYYGGNHFAATIVGSF